MLVNSVRAQNDLGSFSAVPSPLISIEIDTSRTAVSAGAGLGIFAKITNSSNTDIYLKENDLTMTLPIELEAKYGGQYGYTSVFPTEPDYTEPYDTDSIRLSPGDSYTSFWTYSDITKSTSDNYLDPLSYNREIFQIEMYNIFFQPGDYKITINAKYWTDPTLPDNQYRTLTESAVINVSAPQSVILLGASAGGICAYLLLKFSKARRNQALGVGSEDVHSNQICLKYLILIFKFILGSFAFVRDIIGAVLLSGIVTILIARISESKFLVSVEVSDFWGSVATGFIANYAGTSFLKRLVGSEEKNSEDEHREVTSNNNRIGSLENSGNSKKTGLE